MPNTISSIWQFPSGSEYSNGGAAEQYAIGSAPVAAELGVAATPIYETGAPATEAQPAPVSEITEPYYTTTGDPIPTDRSAAVLDAARSVFDALETHQAAAPAPAAPEITHSRTHDQIAFERMQFYGPTLEAMRDSVLGA